MKKQAKTAFLTKINFKTILIGIIFVVFLITRFYNMEQRNPFGWDQVDNAWAAKNILINHQYPLVGMQAKGNSGMFIGPYYYYFIAPFYFFTDLDPAASGVIAGVTSIFTFFVLFFVTKKMFSYPVAMVSVLLYTVSNYQITFDRVQWPVNFIMPISLLMIYALYKIITGYEKYIMLLTLILGFSLHIHFTSLFYFPLILLVLPFFPRTKKTLLFSLYSLPIIFLFILPLIVVWFSGTSSHNFDNFLHYYYHGFHVVRFLQVAHDGFIEYENVLRIPLPIIQFIFLPVFFFFYLLRNRTKERLLCSYLIAIWFFIPWFLFSLYAGEISDYYFSITLPLVYISLAYLSWEAIRVHIITKVLFVGIFLWFAYVNGSNFIHAIETGSIAIRREHVATSIQKGEMVKFGQGVPEAYIYYLYLRKTGQENVIKTYFD